MTPPIRPVARGCRGAIEPTQGTPSAAAMWRGPVSPPTTDARAPRMARSSPRSVGGPSTAARAPSTMALASASSPGPTRRARARRLPPIRCAASSAKRASGQRLSDRAAPGRSVTSRSRGLRSARREERVGRGLGVWVDRERELDTRPRDAERSEEREVLVHHVLRLWRRGHAAVRAERAQLAGDTGREADAERRPGERHEHPLLRSPCASMATSKPSRPSWRARARSPRAAASAPPSPRARRQPRVSAISTSSRAGWSGEERSFPALRDPGDARRGKRVLRASASGSACTTSPRDESLTSAIRRVPCGSRASGRRPTVSAQRACGVPKRSTMTRMRSRWHAPWGRLRWPPRRRGRVLVSASGTESAV